MSGPRPGWDEVNAYVDGELAPRDAARVARAVADDPELAATVAVLARLKAAAAESVRAPDLALPAPPPARRRLAVAAAAILGLLGLAAVLWSAADRPDSSLAWLDRAEADHIAWAAAPGGAQADGQAGALLAAQWKLGGAAVIPVLDAARLKLVLVRTISLEEGEALHLGYVGSRGCRVSLWVRPAPPTLSPDIAERDRDGASAYVWRAGELAYALIASGMAADRLATLARAVHRASLERAPFDAETRTALRRSRETSQPCQT